MLKSCLKPCRNNINELKWYKIIKNTLIYVPLVSQTNIRTSHRRVSPENLKNNKNKICKTATFQSVIKRRSHWIAMKVRFKRRQSEKFGWNSRKVMFYAQTHNETHNVKINVKGISSFFPPPQSVESLMNLPSVVLIGRRRLNCA